MAEIPVAIDLAGELTIGGPLRRPGGLPLNRSILSISKKGGARSSFPKWSASGKNTPPRFWPVHLIPLKKFKKSFRKSLKYKVLPRMLRWRA